MSKKEGGSIDETQYINGVLIDKEVAHSGNAEVDKERQDSPAGRRP